ncbi:MAG TPA: hypothetical protein VMU53_02430 [Candidatus Sulfotelmatobacter sp.]|nr:hypothetical protein [Candidatus Sulfotelmatobacter sp.]
MSFRFRLQTLLRLQRSLEHQEENRLHACVARIAGLQTDLRAWEEARLQRRSKVWTDLQEGQPVAVLQCSSLWEARAHLHENELRHQLDLAEQARQEQLKLYRAARQKREILESLKERQETAYTSEFLRRVQQDLDEAHLMRSIYRKDH